MNKDAFKKIVINWRNNFSARKISSRDSVDHYDLDGVSFSTHGVVIAGDNQTTEGAPPPQKNLSRFRLKASESLLTSVAPPQKSGRSDS